MSQPSVRTLAALKVALFLLCLWPLTRLALALYASLNGSTILGLNEELLGANPIEYIIRDLGTWALRFLLITLCITPLRKLTGLNWLLRFRRMLGLYAFFYALVHFNIYLGLDQSYDWIEIAKDILKRPFITVGMLAFTLMLPLAITSNAAMIKRLGGKRWQALHKMIYPLTMLAVLHYWWLVKKDITQPAIYAGLLSVLLGVRLFWNWRNKQAMPNQPAV
ncbi:MAG TPA: protein-methionine-sulfoxide reductase heme-binding subunit MsrQ [Rhodocyclaceae bacterium]|jgi:sulfoxide reductase heme-binding subunit YedZ|nr:protein-methionine-sulfoxide reductase heme-binding subunit MsrQ [Rhodocyclaceae bacterium]